MNYGELKNLVKQYLHREDLTDYIPSWLEWAHGIIQKNKIFRYQQAEFDAKVLDSSTYEYDLDSDFKISSTTTKCKRIAHILIEQVSDNTRVSELEKKEYPYFEEAKSKIDNKGTEYPLIYTRWHNKIRIYPAGSSDYQMIILGYRELPFYTADNDEDYLSINYPQLLVLGALSYAEPFIKDEQRAQYWMAMYRNHYQIYLEEESLITKSGGTASAPTMW